VSAAAAVTVKEAVVLPVCTWTDAGTVTCELDDARVTVDPPPGALEDRVTVALPVCPADRFVGDTTTFKINGVFAAAEPFVVEAFSDTKATLAILPRETVRDPISGADTKGLSVAVKDPSRAPAGIVKKRGTMRLELDGATLIVTPPAGAADESVTVTEALWPAVRLEGVTTISVMDWENALNDKNASRAILYAT
jgi:hypothetical protein